MKTNQILTSTDRELFNIIIRQSTKTQMLSITDLQEAYDKGRWMYGWKERNVKTIMQSKDFRERLYYVLFERDLIKVGIPTFMEMVETEGIVKTLKGLTLWKTTGRGGKKQVMCDTYIWVLLAMELNPMLYAKVVMWLTDTLIFNRLDAGDEFLSLNMSIRSVISNPNYSLYATEINKKVFGRHERGMRNSATSQELRKISDIEKFLVNAISMSIVKNESHLLRVINEYN